ncbi:MULTISPECIES: GGDEF domain-containing protein [unclassified Rhodococcus (in: high G+C Gram-positive bacteria)]|uniref:putative bifunctional diguanylate cyclase/phosphodiesterase n=1 Tax=unclassified Rhodococcus (in: high G+C Gram-positive bacteria) TaxID=192944 RepID=UPI0027DEFCE8|nr:MULTISPECIES: GGDEF domain-containing protein [unclassified Rhodococcus (in: high G+C Gram-positive bacteria)]
MSDAHALALSVVTDPALDAAVLRSLLEQSPDMIMLSEFSGAVVHVNPVGLTLLGLAALPPAGVTTAEVFTTRGLEVADDVEAALRTVGHWQGRTELRHFGTDVGVPVALSTFVVRRSRGTPDLIATIIRDRTHGHRRDADLVAAARSALRSAAEHRALAELSGLAVSADMPSLLVAATSTAATVVGVESAAVARSVEDAGTLRFDAVTRELRPDVVIAAGTGSLSGYALAHHEATVCVDTREESRFDVSAMNLMGYRSGAAVPITTGAGQWGALIVFGTEPGVVGEGELTFLSAVAGVLSGALERVDLDRRLHRRSMHDPLTGLPNRALVYEAIDSALADENGSVALLLLDVDDFKIINDSLGHDAGDRALVRFARRLVTATRPEDMVARLGGDEFLIVCSGVEDDSHAERLAAHVLTALATTSTLDGAPTPVSASMGVAVSERDSTRRELLRRADLAMYRAKDTGAGGYAVFDPDDLYDADRVRTLSVDLRGALARDELSLHYQPVVDVGTGRIVAVEALARWTHPSLGPIAPSEFVAVAERTGLTTPLGEWSLGSACRQVVQWRRFCDVSVRVNISGLQLRDPAFPARVAATLRETGALPGEVGLEITETVWLADTGRVAANLSALRDLGVALLLDDVGKGYNSLSYLERFPVFESFKIDKAYIDAVSTPRGRAVVSAIVLLAKAYDVTVVGEGVETLEQWEALAAAGCDLVQGFLLGRPADVARTTALLHEQAAGPV